MTKKELLITVIVVVLAIGLIAGVIVANNLGKGDANETTAPTVAHDHNGDGVPDHGDDTHEENGGNDATGESGNQGGSTGEQGGSAGNQGGSSGNAVNPEDTDVDISIELEDLPNNDGGSSTGNEGTSTGSQGGSTGNEGGSTGNEGGSEQGGSTGNEQGGSTGEQGGSSSGAVSGNEIDFDDLLNAGQN